MALVNSVIKPSIPQNDMWAQLRTPGFTAPIVKGSASSAVQPTQGQEQPDSTAGTQSLSDPIASNGSNQNANPLFGYTGDPTLQGQFNTTLNSMMNGSIYDPFAAGSQEALARTEATQRANTGNQIASAGLSGTGIGIQAGQGTENQILQNRFTNNNQIEQNRVNTQEQALNTAQSYGQASQNAFTNNQTIAGTGASQFAGWITNNTPSVNALPGGKATADNVFTIPGAQAAAQSAWTAQGGQGPVPADWAATQINNQTTMGNVTTAAATAVDTTVNNGLMTSDEGVKAKALLSDPVFRDSWSQDPTTGQWTFDASGYANAMAGTSTESASGVVAAGSIPNNPKTASSYAPGSTYTNNGKTFSVNSNGTAQDMSMVDDQASTIANQAGGIGTSLVGLQKGDALYDATAKDLATSNGNITTATQPGTIDGYTAVSGFGGSTDVKALEGKSYNISGGIYTLTGGTWLHEGNDNWTQMLTFTDSNGKVVYYTAGLGFTGSNGLVGY